MGLRCLLGHDFGPPEMERERDEQGDEMVVTVREVQTCQRCGEERVVSENKEVTAIRSPDGVGDAGADDGAVAATSGETDDGTDDGTGVRDAGPAFGPEPAESYDPDADDGVILDDDEPERAPGEWPEHDSEGPTTAPSAERADAAAGADDPGDGGEADGAGADETVDEAEEDEADRVAEVAAEEDAELLDHGDDDPGTATERDAAATASTAGDSAAWPDHDAEDEGFGAGRSEGGPAEVSFGGGDRTAERSERGRGEYVGVDAADEEGFEGIVRTDSAVDGDGDTTEFFCPNCGHSERAGRTSMRVGDICPACHKGYIAERDA